MEFHHFTLPNGMRVLHKPTSTPVAHCGLIINTGARDENESEEGLAHFIEHTLFKGTKKRKAYHILSRLDDVGGDLNAYTSKEETIVYASFLSEYYERAVELIFDIAFHSTYPQKEINKEKDVVLEEISSYLDAPSELIFDDFEQLIFNGHPIGRQILGTPASVASFTREHVLDFVSRTYNPEQMVFASVGNMTTPKFEAMLMRLGQELPQNPRHFERQILNGYSAKEQTLAKETYQSHAIIGNRAFDMKNRNARGLILLNNLLGGPGMNSRLNLNIREKYGFAYQIESFYTPYTDTGIFGVYIGTDKGTLQKSLQLIEKELKVLRDKKLGTLQLSKAKKQLLGQIALSQESNGSLMLSLGKSWLHFDKVDTLEEVQRKVMAITAEEIQDIANEVFDPNNLSRLIYKAKS
ncbi:MAG: insulinase family protein [Schleiferiaceae bacterium]|nr:insulinase family protein [Schleiferiaceae bacterium]